MNRTFYLFTFFYLLSFFAYSQQVDGIDIYREDQFYIGFSLAIQDQGSPEFKQNGFSTYFYNNNGNIHVQHNRCYIAEAFLVSNIN